MTAAERAQAMRRRGRLVDPPTESEPTPAVEPPPASPPKPVRQTVDLPHARHLAFAAWRMETAVQLGRSRLTTQDALAAVVEVLLTDEMVSRRVRAFLEAADGT